MNALAVAVLRFARRLRRGRFVVVGLIGAVAAQPALACETPTSTSVTVGSFSPAALNQGAVPYTSTGTGFTCSTLNVLTLLSGNYLAATITAGTVMKLTSTSNPTSTITYQLFANGSAAYELKPGIKTFYMNGAALNLLNIAGDQGLNVKMFFKFPAGAIVTPGTYTGSVPIKWEWNFCNGIAAAGLCVGQIDSGMKTITVAVTLIVETKNPTVALVQGPVTWDPVNGTFNPKGIPGGKQRVIVTITNPDIVSTTDGALYATLPTANRTAIALDGDGTGNGAVVQVTQGSTPSGTTITYASPGSSTDQLDFSSDGGATWSFVPVPADPASQNTVTAVRIKPLGGMAPLSSVSVSIPYSVR